MMDPKTDNLERLLATLGEAHRDGAFGGDAARFPWQAGEPGAQRPAQRRLAWLWVGAPLAAAAAVAVLFVGPSLFPRQAVREVARTLPTQLLPEHPEVLAAVDTTSATAPDECDYNGDGVVNGEDIQALVKHLQESDGEGDPLLEAEMLQRCLLGS